MKKFFYIFVLAMTVWASAVVAEEAPHNLYCKSQARPWDVTVDDQGSVYVTDITSCKAFKYNHDGDPISSWGSYGSEPGQFWSPTGIVAGHDGYIYVSDLNNERIQKFSKDGSLITTWSTRVTSQNQWSSQPYGIDQGPDGLIYVADIAQYAVLVYTGEGVLVRYWLVNPDGPVWSPIGIAVGGDGRVYVSAGSGDVVVYSSAGVLLNRWNALNYSYHVAVDHLDNVYVVGHLTNSVGKYTSSGTLLGEWSVGDHPTGVDVDQYGWVFVTGGWAPYFCAYGNLATPTTKSTWGHLKAKYR